MKKNSSSFLYHLFLLTVFFNIWFPKAGIKVSGIPLTIGNALFGITFIFWLITKLNKKKTNINKTGILIIICSSLFLLKFLFVGDFIKNIGFIIPLIIYPLVYFLSFDIVENEDQKNKVIKVIIYGFIFITFYALIQFVFGIDKTTIPGLTVNYSDYKELGTYWYMTKSNGVTLEGAKIVSTYQNGNIFGVNLLLIYPIVYYYLKEKKYNTHKLLSLIIFVITIFLTLSRACWFGLIIFIFLCILREKSISKKDIINKLLLLLLFVLSIIIVFKYMPSVADRFFNTKINNWVSMSGRTEGMLSVFSSLIDSNEIMPWFIGPYGIINYSGLAYEMFPLAVFVRIGIIGLLLIYKVIIGVLIKYKANDFFNKSIRYSIIIWLIVGLIESAYWLPPTALNIFLILGLYKTKYESGEL